MGKALGGEVVIIWDALDSLCASLARAIYIDFHSICRFIEVHNTAEVDQEFSFHPHAPKDALCQASRLTALLPNGVYIANVQRHQRILLYELQYALIVNPPPMDEQRALECKHIDPIAKLCRSPCTQAFQRW